MKPLHLVTFDVTNTLIKIKTSIGHEYCKIACLYGVKCDDQLVKRVNQNFRLTLRQLKKESPLYGIKEGISCNQWWEQAVHRTFISSGLDESSFPQAKSKLVATHLYKHFSTSEPYQLVEGSVNTLTFLRSKSSSQLKLGIISNSDERLLYILAQLGIGHLFDFIILPQFAKVEKPDQKVFQLALDKAKTKEPNQALHIGDNIEKDYFGAKNCNWNSILVTGNVDNDGIKEKGINPDDVINSVKDLPNHAIFETFN